MTTGYYKNTREFTENLAHTIFTKAGFHSVLNNKKNISAVDVIINDKIKIDVQYSNNYARYGDFRLDFISAFTYVNQPMNNSADTIFTAFEKSKQAKILKKGKYFEDPNYLDDVIIFFYNHRLDLSSTRKDTPLNNINEASLPDYTLIVNGKALINHVEKNYKKYFYEIKINNKQNHNIDESHESAFIPIKVDTILNEFNQTDYLWTDALPTDAMLTNFFQV